MGQVADALRRSIPFRLLDAELLLAWLRDEAGPEFETETEGALVMIPFVSLIELERRIRELLDGRELHPFEEDEIRELMAEKENAVIYPDRDIARSLVERMRVVYRGSGEANLYCEWLRVLTAAIRRTGAEDVKVLTRSPYVARQLGNDALLLP